MDGFIAHSNGCLNRVVDHIGGVESKSDVRKLTDVYQHLLKAQRAAIESGDPGSEAALRFHDEWAVCEPALRGEEGEEAEPASPGERPSEEQLVEFKKTVSAWFRLDDDEKELRRRAGEKRLLKSRLSASIVAFMKRFDIEDLKTKDGGLRCFTRTVKKLPSRTVQMERIDAFFASDGSEGASALAASFKEAVFEPQDRELSGIRRLKGAAA